MSTDILEVEFRALEPVFAAEIANRPFQSKAKIYIALEDQGYVKRGETVLPGEPAVMLKDVVMLTLAGHMAYCAACEKYLEGEGWRIVFLDEAGKRFTKEKKYATEHDAHQTAIRHINRTPQAVALLSPHGDEHTIYYQRKRK